MLQSVRPCCWAAQLEALVTTTMDTGKEPPLLLLQTAVEGKVDGWEELLKLQKTSSSLKVCCRKRYFLITCPVSALIVRYISLSSGIQPQDNKKTAGPAMSAWGIIAIIMTLCLSLMGVYYFTLFYPILCKKERKYDCMDLGSQ